MNFKTKPTIAYSNPTASCLSPRLMSTGNNLGETEVFNAVRCGFAEVKLQIKTTIRPRQNRGKWSHSFKRYCITMMWQNVYSVTVDYIFQLPPPQPVCYSLVVSFTGIKHSVTGTWFIAQTFTLVLGLVCGDSKPCD